MALLVGISSVLIAQPRYNDQVKPMKDKQWKMQMKDDPDFKNHLNLTDEQKEFFKQSMMAMHKEVLPLKNELGEVMAHQNTLMTADKPDMKAVNQNLEKAGTLKTKLAQIQAKHRLDLRAQLTDEQKMKFDMMKGDMNRHDRPERNQRFGPMN